MKENIDVILKQKNKSFMSVLNTDNALEYVLVVNGTIPFIIPFTLNGPELNAKVLKTFESKDFIKCLFGIIFPYLNDVLFQEVSSYGKYNIIGDINEIVFDSSYDGTKLNFKPLSEQKLRDLSLTIFKDNLNLDNYTYTPLKRSKNYNYKRINLFDEVIPKKNYIGSTDLSKFDFSNAVTDTIEFKSLEYNINRCIPTLLFGEPGTGKTYLVYLIAKLHNIPLFVFNCNAGMEAQDLCARYMPNTESTDEDFDKILKDNGNVIEIKGDDSKAFKKIFTSVVKGASVGKCIILLDEIYQLPAATASILLSMLDGTRTLVLDNLTINVPEDVAVIATANVGVNGSSSQNQALLGRFSEKIYFPQLAKDEVVSRLSKNNDDYKLLDAVGDLYNYFVSKKNTEYYVGCIRYNQIENFTKKICDTDYTDTLDENKLKDFIVDSIKNCLCSTFIEDIDMSSYYKTINSFIEQSDNIINLLVALLYNNDGDDCTTTLTVPVDICNNLDSIDMSSLEDEEEEDK